MKNNKFSRSNVAGAFAALALLVIVVLGCNSEFSIGEPTLPPHDEIQSLVRNTIIDFSDGVEKGDFTDFHKTTSSAFSEQFSPEKLNSTFAVFIDAKNEAVPIFKKAVTMDAEFTAPPAIVKENNVNKLKTEGIFRSSPSDVEFKLDYLRESGNWKVIKVEVYITPK